MKLLLSVIVFTAVPYFVLNNMLMPQIDLLRDVYTNIDTIPGRLDPEYKQLGM